MPGDQLSGNVGYTNAYFLDRNGTTIQTGRGTTATPAEFYALSSIPGSIPVSAVVQYDHTMPLPGGFKLLLNGQVR